MGVQVEHARVGQNPATRVTLLSYNTLAVGGLHVHSDPNPSGHNIWSNSSSLDGQQAPGDLKGAWMLALKWLDWKFEQALTSGGKHLAMMISGTPA